MFSDDAIFFFDFDGVLIEQCDEKVYRLPEGGDERDRLSRLAESYGIDSSLYRSTQYLRHLTYQAAARERPVPDDRFMSLIDELHDNYDPYFVITARSGLYAVDRAMQFIMQQLDPQEVFFLGRSSKAALLDRMSAEWPERDVIFFDDTFCHIDETLRLGNPRIKPYLVLHDECQNNARRLVSSTLGYDL
jgi:hypothetical protein